MLTQTWWSPTAGASRTQMTLSRVFPRCWGTTTLVWRCGLCLAANVNRACAALPFQEVLLLLCAACLVLASHAVLSEISDQTQSQKMTKAGEIMS